MSPDCSSLQRGKGTALVKDALERLQAKVKLFMAHQNLLLAKSSSAVDILADELFPPFVLWLDEILLRRLDNFSMWILLGDLAHKLQGISLVDDFQFI